MLVTPILELSAHDAYIMRSKGKINLSLHILLLTASIHILLKSDYYDRYTWIIQGGSSMLRDHIITSGLTKIFNKLHQPQSPYPLLFTRQTPY